MTARSSPTARRRVPARHQQAPSALPHAVDGHPNEVDISIANSWPTLAQVRARRIGATCCEPGAFEKEKPARIAVSVRIAAAVIILVRAAPLSQQTVGENGRRSVQSIIGATARVFL